VSTMLGNRKLVLDHNSEVYPMLENWVDQTFYDFKKHLEDNEFIPGATYLIGREQTRLNVPVIRQLIETNVIKVVYSNPAEGSETMINQLKHIKLFDLVESGKLPLITGGHVPQHIPHLYHENFLPKVLNYDENLQAINNYKLMYKLDRPYKFLFFNGRGRWHRKYLIDQLGDTLDQALWTNLDTINGPIKLLPDAYEVPKYVHSMEIPENGCVKTDLFGPGIWGDVILYEAPYLDTYFSLISETVNAIPYSFRTEKIWKPIAMGHPWIAASSQGYYKDIHDLGFRTFGHLIDERFDQIENAGDRMDRIADLVKDLCQQDLPAFLTAAQETCKYNQQLMAELGPKITEQFPERFFQFARHYRIDE
jgi:hypothetical protein